MNVIEAHALSATVEARIAALWRQRQLDRCLAYHTPARHDREMELRALVRLVRSARRLARRTVEAQDPITDYHAWQAWSEGELVAGFGK